MEPQNGPNRKIIVIRMEQNNSDRLDPDLERWLAEFVSNMEGNEMFRFNNLDETGEPTEMAELEYLDSIVQGDEHPEALDMIMGAYRKHQGA